MPRYFFHVNDGVDSPDLSGTEFPGPDEARSEAVVACGETLRSLDGTFWGSRGWARGGGGLRGSEFPGPGEARSGAVVACGETLRSLDGKFWDSRGWEMVVEDVRGNVV